MVLRCFIFSRYIVLMSVAIAKDNTLTLKLSAHIYSEDINWFSEHPEIRQHTQTVAILIGCPFHFWLCFVFLSFFLKKGCSLYRPQFNIQDKCKVLLCSPFVHNFLKPWHCFEFQCEGFEVDLVQRQWEKHTAKHMKKTPVQETSSSLWQQIHTTQPNTQIGCKWTNYITEK